MPVTPREHASQPAVHLSGLSHQYRGSAVAARQTPADAGPNAQPHTGLALDAIELTIHHGELFGLLGPNGSGKTTLLRILCSLLPPQSGHVRVIGFDPSRQPQPLRQRIGVVFQHASLDKQLTARENLTHQGQLYGLNGSALRARVDELLTAFGLIQRADDRAGRFSGGMMRRLELARALLHRPALLLMDEPTTGLDPAARHELWQYLHELRQQRPLTVVVSTHLMDEAERCDRLAVMQAGRILAAASPGELKAKIRGEVITVEADPARGPDEPEALCHEIADRFGPWSPGRNPTLARGRIRFESPRAAEMIPQLVAAFNGRIHRISLGQPTLEDVFLQLTGHDLHRDEAKA